MSTEEKSYEISIDRKEYKWEKASITGSDIKKLAGIPMNYAIWLKNNGPAADIEVLDNQAIDISQKGKEHFFSGPKNTTEG